MEQLLFENRYVDNEKMIAEINRKVWCRKRYPVGWFLVAYAALYTLFIVISGNWDTVIVPFLLLGYGVYHLNYHNFWAKRVMRKVKKENNGQIFPATITVADKFIHQYRATTFSFPFSSLKKAYFLKHSILLINDNNTYMTFQRTGFTKGNSEELESFIREKCPQAQIIHKE